MGRGGCRIELPRRSQRLAATRRSASSDASGRIALTLLKTPLDALPFGSRLTCAQIQFRYTLVTAIGRVASSLANPTARQFFSSGDGAVTGTCG
jgi:hypothetical protein